MTARLTEAQLQAIKNMPGIKRIHGNDTVKTASIEGCGLPYLDFPSLVGADQLHPMAIDGRDVTVAVLDSGLQQTEELLRNADGNNRVLAKYQAMTDVEGKALDRRGHGSHLSSIILNSEVSSDGKFNSIAPAVNVLAVKAFSPQGNGTYANVIRGLQWILDHKDEYAIRVVNLSFSATPRSHYWDDPMNQAVMRLWQAGIVVVASAGNTGPEAMTIGVPGNVPYIITVGAMTDRYTPGDSSDDVWPPSQLRGLPTRVLLNQTWWPRQPGCRW